MKCFHRNKGFTLIELLVVISIISLLSSVVLASVVEVRDRAKVTAFVQDVKQAQLAMEVYKLDNGFYPLESFEGQQFGGANQKSGNYIDLNALDTYLNSAVDGVARPDFIPKYLPKFPAPLILNASPDSIHVINYYNNALINASYYSTYSCGGNPIKGYLIEYYTNLSPIDGINLPRLYDSNGDETFSYCLTGQQ